MWRNGYGWGIKISDEPQPPPCKLSRYRNGPPVWIDSRKTRQRHKLLALWSPVLFLIDFSYIKRKALYLWPVKLCLEEEGGRAIDILLWSTWILSPYHLDIQTKQINDLGSSVHCYWFSSLLCTTPFLFHTGSSAYLTDPQFN